ncbi:sugar ABC transporter permease [Enterococcus casseliflavus]|nr:sugar ABC transporter permease [Enterococcus casseliflavus]
MTSMKRKHWGFILPGLTIYTIFAIIPIFCAMYYSFFDWSGLGEMNFVGLNNFITLFTDPRIAPDFFNALTNNLKYILCIWFIVTPVQFVLAYLLFIKIRGHEYFKFMLFFPYVISSTIVGFFATLIFDPNIGLLNSFLSQLNLPQGLWLGDPSVAFKILIIAVLWQGIGTGMMIFYSDMQGISLSVLEAADMDGASGWVKFSKIILPMSMSSVVTNVSMSTIWALALFDLPYLLGGVTGGAGKSLDFVNIMFYRYTFGTALNGKTNMGFGAAISVIMFMIIGIITFLVMKIMRSVERRYR